MFDIQWVTILLPFFFLSSCCLFLSSLFCIQCPLNYCHCESATLGVSRRCFYRGLSLVTSSEGLLHPFHFCLFGYYFPTLLYSFLRLLCVVSPFFWSLDSSSTNISSFACFSFLFAVINRSLTHSLIYHPLSWFIPLQQPLSAYLLLVRRNITRFAVLVECLDNHCDRQRRIYISPTKGYLLWAQHKNHIGGTGALERRQVTFSIRLFSTTMSWLFWLAAVKSLLWDCYSPTYPCHHLFFHPRSNSWDSVLCFYTGSTRLSANWQMFCLFQRCPLVDQIAYLFSATRLIVSNHHERE